MENRAGDPRVLHEIVSTVASSLDLDQVLDGVVRLLSDASGVRACFVYLREGEADAESLVLRAASAPYGSQVGKVRLERGEGLAWWSIEHGRPGFIRDDAMADPRTKYVPELEEERFQSLLAVPVLSRSGTAIGVITAHTEAPREFTDAEVEFLVTSASLVGGAIENARLYEDARTRVEELEQLTGLAEAIARAEEIDELVQVVVADARSLLGANACHLYLLDAPRQALVLAAAHPAGGDPPATIALSELGPELVRSRRRAARVSIPLVASGELVGLLVAAGTTRVDLARMVASQAAVGIKKVQLIARLTETNLIKDFFEQLAGGRRRGDLGARAAKLGVALSQPHVVVEARPPDDGLAPALRALAPGTLIDRTDDSWRALVRVPPEGPGEIVRRVGELAASTTPPMSVGVSSICAGEASFEAGFAEARQALVGGEVLRGSPRVVSYEELGAYRYLLHSGGDAVRDATVDAVKVLADYDSAHGTALLATLEELLRRRGSVSQAAAVLYVHPNTLRQRLRRIRQLTGLALTGDEDWLSVELAVRVVRLRLALADGEW